MSARAFTFQFRLAPHLGSACDAKRLKGEGAYIVFNIISIIHTSSACKDTMKHFKCTSKQAALSTPQLALKMRTPNAIKQRP